MKERSFWLALEATGAAIAAFWLKVPFMGQFLVGAMTLDVALGVLAAGRAGIWTSRGMSPGLRKKTAELLVVGILFYLDRSLGAPMGTAAAGWFAIREIRSIKENLKLLKVELPPSLDATLEASIKQAGGAIPSEVHNESTLRNDSSPVGNNSAGSSAE